VARKGYRECPVCAQEILVNTRICRFCGAVLIGDPLPPASSTGTVAAEPEADYYVEIRRLVESLFSHTSGGATRQARRLEEFLRRAKEEYPLATVMFTDFAGLTAINEMLRSDLAIDMIDLFQEVCNQAVESFDGFAAQFLGDGCLIVFGVPVAHDGDVESAVRAALRIRDQVRQFPHVKGHVMRAHIGLATGELCALITRHPTGLHFDVFGPCVNLAARLSSAAEHDTVLVCPTTHEIVRGVFDFRRKRARRFKNISRPVETFEVLGAREEATEA